MMVIIQIDGIWTRRNETRVVIICYSTKTSSSELWAWDNLRVSSLRILSCKLLMFTLSHTSIFIWVFCFSLYVFILFHFLYCLIFHIQVFIFKFHIQVFILFNCFIPVLFFIYVLYICSIKHFHTGNFHLQSSNFLIM